MRPVVALFLTCCVAAFLCNPSRAATVAAGADHTCALSESGVVLCWGDNALQQLGLDPVATPWSRGPAAPVPLPESAVALVSGNAFSCALLTPSNQVACWGANDAGQTGAGTSSASSGPVLVLAPDGIAPLANVVRLTAGEAHACAVMAGGQAVCWGANDAMQLGNDIPGNASIPAFVRAPGSNGNLSGVTEIAAGASHTCAISVADVLCWGDNSGGQLGDNNRPVDSSLPVQTINLDGAIALAAGRSHTCALMADGGVRCWGVNSSGQIGIGLFSQSKEVPAIVRNTDNTAALSNISALTQGSGLASHTCAISAVSDQMYCWGEGEYAQLGNGEIANRALPTPVTGSSLASGGESAVGQRHSCMRASVDEISCWGDNASGTIGNGAPLSRAAPVRVLLPEDTHAMRVSMGGSAGGGAHACATTASGEIHCWGNNVSGQLGNGDDTPRPLATPQIVSFSGDSYLALAIAAGGQHTCAMRGPAQVFGLWCWGNGLFGQLGAGGVAGPFFEPQQAVLGVTPPLRDTHLASGAFHSCILNGSNGEAWCWGSGAHGRLGNGSVNNQNGPVKVLEPSGNANLQNLVGITAGEAHTCARRLIGIAYCWGRGHNGELGNAQAIDALLPQIVVGPNGAPFLTPVTDIRAGRAHTCAIADGALYCWGGNTKGQLGNGSATVAPSYSPVASTMPVGMEPIRLDVGTDHACAAMRETASGRHTVFCWGANDSGQLGDGSFEQRATPVEVTGLPESSDTVHPIVDLAAGHDGTCVAFGAGDTWCWGDNSSGALGNAEGPKYYVPEPVNSFAIDDVMRSEGADGGATTEFTFTVRRTLARDAASIKYAVVHDSTVAADLDFSAHPANGSLDFPRDVFERDVVVQIANDAIAEPDEQFLVVLSDSSSGTGALGDVGVGTILDDEVDPPVYSLTAIVGCDAHEGMHATDRTVRLRVSGSIPVPAGQSYQVKWNVPLVAGVAKADAADFASAPMTGTVTLMAGESFKEFDVVVRGDALVEADEAFDVALVDAGSAILSASSAGVECVIRNDDTWVALEPDAGAAAMEGAEAVDRTARFRVSLSNIAPQPVTLTYQVVGSLQQGATEGEDFSLSQPQTLTIPAGAAEGFIDVVVHGDDDEEATEGFVVQLVLVTSGNGTIDPAHGGAAGTIIDDDDPQQVNFVVTALASADQAEGDSGTRDFSFQVARSGDAPSSIQIRVLDGVGSAAATLAGGDFLPLGMANAPLTVEFADGAPKSIHVKVAGDSVNEPDEHFRVELFNPSAGATVVVATAEGWIRDDDTTKLFGDGFE